MDTREPIEKKMASRFVGQERTVTVVTAIDLDDEIILVFDGTVAKAKEQLYLDDLHCKTTGDNEGVELDEGDREESKAMVNNSYHFHEITMRQV